MARPQRITEKPEEIHEFRAWREKRRVSRADAAERATKLLGRRVSDRYLGMIEAKRRRPLWEVAKALSMVSGGEVPADRLMESGYCTKRRAD